MAKFQNIKPGAALTSWYQSVRQDPLFWLFFSAWLLPLVFSIIHLGFSLSSLPSQIPLFYSHPWGETQLAPNSYVFLPMAGIFLLGVFNFSLGTSFHNRRPILSYLLEGTAALLSFLSAITIFNIVNLMR